MDPYNQQQYPYQFPQQTPGPPQPPWQAPPRRTGWGDPRPSQQMQSPISPYDPNAFGYIPPPPPPPPPPPDQYGSPPPSNYASNTSAWGVKYNQNPRPQHGIENKPALPPRPSSTTGNQNTRPDITGSPNYWQQDGGTSMGAFVPHHQSQSSWSNPYQAATTSQQSMIPPPPPPRPPEYQSEIQAQIQYQQSTLPHDHYSHQGPSHHYDPTVQQGYGNTTTHHQFSPAYNAGPQTFGLPDNTYQNNAPVSPIEPDLNNWNNPQYSNAHYGDGNVPAFIPASGAEDSRPVASAWGSGGPSDWEHLGNNNAPGPVSPPKTHAVPDKDRPEESRPVPPSTPPLQTAPGNEHQSWPRRQDSETSSLAIEGIRRTGTIDSVINAWNSPLRVAAKSESESDGRPKSRVSSRAHSPTPPKIVEVTKIVDPYEDLEPEFKASLKRYVAMLRKEAVANTDEDKFEVFQNFVSKELRLRSMLYGIEAQQLPVPNTKQRTSPEALSSDRTLPTSKSSSIPALKIEDYPNPAKRLSAIVPIEEQLSPESRVPPWQDLAPRPKPPEAATPNEAILHSPPPPPPTPTPIPVSVPSAEAIPQATEKSVPSTENKTTAGEMVKQLQDSLTEKDSITAARSSTPVKANLTAPDNDDTQSPSLTIDTVATSNSGSKVDDVEYSPGGRPLMPKLQTLAMKKPERQMSEIDSAYTDVSVQQTPKESPSNNAPIVLQDYVMSGPSSPGRNAPILIEHDHPSPVRRRTTSPGLIDSGSVPVASQKHSDSTSSTTPAVKFEPSRPAYTPFRYNLPDSAPSLPADKSYSLLRQEAVDSGRILSHEPMSPSDANVPTALRPTSAVGNKVHDEAFIGLIRQQSKIARNKELDLLKGAPQLRVGTPRAQNSATAAAQAAQAGAERMNSVEKANRAATPFPTMVPATDGEVTSPVTHQHIGPNDLLQAAQSLRSLLPDSIPPTGSPPRAHQKITNLKSRIDDIPDQFSFIHDTVLAWDRSNREVRRKQDEERHVRQADNEAHVDELFNSNEIGYADIGDLESDFKLVEAGRKYSEDQAEVDSFTHGVFQPVTERILGEVEELMKLYTLALDMLDLESKAASRTIQKPVTSQNPSPTRADPEGKVDMASTMTLLLVIFSKLELRQLKLAEANVERERRRKRLELTVLFTNGDTTGVKKLEADFATGEKMAVLQEARNKDVRANKLMDAFDRACVKGLGDNQYFVDEILAGVKQIHSLISQDKTEGGGDDLNDIRSTLLVAQQATDFILDDSRRLMTLSNTADKILNDADYAVSVAEARVSNADTPMYAKLQSEKSKEDAKILEDTNARLASIATAPEETLILIGEILSHSGETGVNGERDGRMRKALELAKARNKDSEFKDIPLT